MKADRQLRRRSEQGIALLIAIFVLLLISVVAIALLVSSGTETALGANYRSSSTVYYAALAGLEEARGRLLPKNPDYFNKNSPPSPPTIPAPFLLGQAVYVVNRVQSESIVPWDSSNKYYDNEYQSEFGVPASSISSPTSVPSVWDNDVKGIPGPAYKWVRINAATEQSLYMDVDQDGTIDTTPALFWDSTNATLTASATPPVNAVQALEITALAALPNGSQKYLQYLVAPSALNLNLPAALTVAGKDVGNNSTYPFSVPNSALFLINGNDQFSAPGCTPGPNPVAAIGYTNNSVGDSSQTTITAAVNSGGYPANYTPILPPPPSPHPNVSYVGSSLAANLQSISGLDSIVRTITQNADLVLPGGLTQSDSTNYMPAWMSPTNPATIVVNGDLTFNGWHNRQSPADSGYGILLVTGEFTFDPDASWDGLVLVIGKGVMHASQHGAGRFHGAVFLATTVDSSNNPLSSLGSPTFSFTSGAGSYGIYYSSCWVKYVQTPFKYQVLSFHEIPQ